MENFHPKKTIVRRVWKQFLRRENLQCCPDLHAVFVLYCLNIYILELSNSYFYLSVSKTNEIVNKPFYRPLHAVSSIKSWITVLFHFSQHASDILNILVVNVCDVWSITVITIFLYTNAGIPVYMYYKRSNDVV